jgi:hypothetical protein
LSARQKIFRLRAIEFEGDESDDATLVGNFSRADYELRN